MSSTKKKAKKSKSSGGSALHSRVAKKVVSESLSLKPGESVTIETWNDGLDFAKEVVKEARRVGALPLLILEDEDAYLWGLKNTPSEYLGRMGNHEYSLLSSTNAYVFIPGPAIGIYTPMVPNEQGSAATAYNSSWYEAAEKAGVRGVRLTFGYVGQDLAKLLGKKREDIISRQLKASLVDFSTIREIGKPILDRLADGVEASIQSGPNTLTFRLKGDLGFEDGITDEADIASKNEISYVLPGMIWKEVDSETASGKVAVSSAITRAGLVKDAIIEFENGRVTGWKTKNKPTQKILDTILEALPEEKRKLTLMTVGLNPDLGYGFGQDRFVSGAVGISGFGFTGVVQRGALSVNGQPIVEKGKIAPVVAPAP
jgi:aminopeptidase